MNIESTFPSRRKSGRDSCTSRNLLYPFCPSGYPLIYIPIRKLRPCRFIEIQKPFLNGLLMQHLLIGGNNSQSHYITRGFVSRSSLCYDLIRNIICPSIDECAIRKPFMHHHIRLIVGFFAIGYCLTTSRFFTCRYERIALLYQPHYNISILLHHCIFERSHIIFLNAKL